MTEINPLDYYIPPFRENGVYILDCNGNMVATNAYGGNSHAKYITDVLNGEREPVKGYEYTCKDGKIIMDKYGVILVLRGRGHLVGRCGHTAEEFAKIQDAMGEWIVRKLKGE